jgi:hypothetical protein
MFAQFAQKKISFNALYPLVIIVAVLVRIAHLFTIGIRYPFAEAGLYAEFGRQIFHHQFLLPETIPFYSDGGIPFGYMPVPFYLLAILTNVLKLPIFPVVNLLPPFISISSLAVFVLLLNNLELDRQERLYGLIGFAIFPLCFEEFVEPAGLAESVGNFFLILFTYALIKNTMVANRRTILFAGGTFALCVMSSPGSAMVSSVLFLVFFAYAAVRLLLDKSGFPTLVSLFIAGCVAILISSPYWVTVMRNHGIQLFSSVFMAQSSGISASFTRILETLLQFQARISFFNFFPVAFVIFWGILQLLLRQKLSPLATAFICYLGFPREGWTIGIFVAIGFGVGISALLKMGATLRRNVNFFALFLIILVSINVIVDVYFSVYVRYQAKEEPEYWPSLLQATEWVQSAVDSDKKIVIATDLPILLEWFPYLTSRTVLNMGFGTEWVPQRQQQIAEFNKTLSQNGFGDLQETVYSYFGYREFLFVLIKPADQYEQSDLASINVGLHPLPGNLGNPVYRNEKVLIYDCTMRP